MYTFFYKYKSFSRGQRPVEQLDRSYIIHLEILKCFTSLYIWIFINSFQNLVRPYQRQDYTLKPFCWTCRLWTWTRTHAYTQVAPWWKTPNRFGCTIYSCPKTILGLVTQSSSSSGTTNLMPPVTTNAALNSTSRSCNGNGKYSQLPT